MVKKSEPESARQSEAETAEPAAAPVPHEAPVPVDGAGLEREGAVLLVPLEAIELVPQPRQHFDPGALEELADEIWARGLEQPITAEIVDGGAGLVFRVRAGERRYRAFRLLRTRRQEARGDPDERWNRYQGYGLIPVIPKALEGDAALRLLIQMGENEMRSGLTLYERSQALLEALQKSGLSSVEFARRYMGRTKKNVAEVKLSYARRVVRIAAENEIARRLLERRLLADPEAVALFAKLPEDKQRALARRAETQGEALSRGQLAKHEDAGARKEAGPAEGGKRDRGVVVGVRASWVGPIVGLLEDRAREEEGEGREELEKVLGALRALLDGAGGRVILELKT